MEDDVTGWHLVGLWLAGCGAEETDKDPPATIDTGGPPVERLADVVINEFMAQNLTTLADETNAFPDWVELYNADDVEADIGGWWLTDDNDYPFRWLIPDGTTIPPKGFLVIFCSGDPARGPLHANFRLDLAGEDVGLFGPNRLDNPKIDAIDDFGAQQADVSLARVPDGSPMFVFASPATPGESNGN